MKKIGLLSREKVTQELIDRLGKSRAYFFVGFNKTKAFPVNVVRNDLRKTKASFFVAKNTLLLRAFTDIGRTDINDLLQGETAVVFAQDKDIVSACKVLVSFSKENGWFKIKGAFLEDKRLGAADIDNLVKLPPKDILLGMAVSSLASPISGFISTLNQLVVNFMWVIEEIKKKKGQ